MYQYLMNTGIRMYDLIGFLGVLAMLLFNLAQYSRKREFLSQAGQRMRSWSAARKTGGRFLAGKAFWVVMEIVLFSFVQGMLVGPLNVNFGPLVGTGANYFGTLFFMPLILTALSVLLGVNPMKQLDLMTPAFPLMLTFAKAACFCHGCCRGIECSFGMYNHNSQLVEFPVQLVEMFFAVGIFLFLLKWRDKAKEGTLFPLYAILFSGTRFFSEFLRCEKNLWGPFKTYQFLCVLGILYGIVGYITAEVLREKIQKHYQ